MLDLERVDVDATFVLVRRSQDVALVEQPVERLDRADVAQVEQHLVPEAGVQQVQHRVLDAAHVQVDAAGLRRAPAGPSSSASFAGSTNVFSFVGSM